MGRRRNRSGLPEPRISARGCFLHQRRVAEVEAKQMWPSIVRARVLLQASSECAHWLVPNGWLRCHTHLDPPGTGTHHWQTPTRLLSHQLARPLLFASPVSVLFGGAAVCMCVLVTQGPKHRVAWPDWLPWRSEVAQSPSYFLSSAASCHAIPLPPLPWHPYGQ